MYFKLQKTLQLAGRKGLVFFRKLRSYANLEFSILSKKFCKVVASKDVPKSGFDLKIIFHSFPIRSLGLFR
jgi:hypothetical protein